MSELTVLLEAARQGDAQAAEQLLPLVYEELRRLAAARMALEAPGNTLQPTALVHEAWLRLAGKENRKWNDRAHFFAAAAEARRKRAQRHGGGQLRVEMPEIACAVDESGDQILAVHEALENFAAQDKLKAELVKLRYFVGLTIDEAAEVLGLSGPTAKRYWAYARAWLAEEIRPRQRR
jgi:RNA polymerase sigma factor (TIGR02999 family)